MEKERRGPSFRKHEKRLDVDAEIHKYIERQFGPKFYEQWLLSLNSKKREEALKKYL